MFKNIVSFPKVSIIIPVFNGSNFIDSAINSALNQTYPNCEIIVINDGSTDDGKTERQCLKFGDNINYISYNENKGVSNALNLGLNHAKGKYISWLSHDDEYVPNKIELQVRALSKEKRKVVGVFTDYNLINYYSDRIGNVNIRNYLKLYSSGKSIDKIAFLNGLINGSTMLVKKSVLTSFNGFDRKLKTTQDYDMWFKILTKYDLVYLDQSLVNYRIHSLQGTNSKKFIHEGNIFWSKIIKNLEYETLDNFELNTEYMEYILYGFLKNSPYKKSYIKLEKNFNHNLKKDYKILKLKKLINLGSNICLIETKKENINKVPRQIQKIIIHIIYNLANNNYLISKKNLYTILKKFDVTKAYFYLIFIFIYSYKIQKRIKYIIQNLLRKILYDGVDFKKLKTQNTVLQQKLNQNLITFPIDEFLINILEQGKIFLILYDGEILEMDTNITSNLYSVIDIISKSQSNEVKVIT